RELADLERLDGDPLVLGLELDVEGGLGVVDQAGDDPQQRVVSGGGTAGLDVDGDEALLVVDPLARARVHCARVPQGRTRVGDFARVAEYAHSRRVSARSLSAPSWPQAQWAHDQHPAEEPR